jgi:hypothetical protein
MDWVGVEPTTSKVSAPHVTAGLRNLPLPGFVGERSVSSSLLPSLSFFRYWLQSQDKPKWTIREIGPVSSNSAIDKIIITTMLMTLSNTIVYSVVVVVVWLSLLCCCGLGCNDNCSGNNINAATTQLPGTLLQRFEAL